MKKHNIRKYAILLVVGVQLFTITACSKSNNNSNSIISEKEDNSVDTSSSDTASTQNTDDGTTKIYGEVTKIDGNNITISLGTLNEDLKGGERGPGDGGNPPGDKTDGNPPADNRDSSNGNDNAVPPDDNNSSDSNKGTSSDTSAQDDNSNSGSTDNNTTDSNKSNSEIKGGPEGGFSMLTLTGEEKTITISDESIISARTADGTVTGLSAIEVGSTIMVTYIEDDNGDENLSAVDVMGGMGPNQDNSNQDSSNSDSSNE